MPGIGEPPAGIDPVLDDGNPAVEDELLDELREPGRDGIDDDEEEDDVLGIEGIDDDDDDEDALGIDGADEELELGDDEALGIDDDELELELLVLSHPPRTRLSADTARTARIGLRRVLIVNGAGVRILVPPQLPLLRNRSVNGFTV